METIEQSLLPKLAQVKQYLVARVEQEIAYQGLIDKIDDNIAKLTQYKPKIKLVSDEIDFSRKLKYISINDLSLNEHYQFHVVPANSLVENIIQDCETILIVCDLHSLISPRNKQIIEAAIAQDIYLKVIIVSQSDELIKPRRAISRWLKLQNSDLASNILWSKENLLILDNADSLQHYQCYLEQKICFARVQLQRRCAVKITRIIKHHIEKLNQATWKTIQAQKNQQLEGKPPEVFRQKFNQLINQVNKLQQQQFLKIKQGIQHNRSCLNNPFLNHNLLWQTQQIIQGVEVNVVKIEQQKYLVGMVKVKDSLEPLHLHLLKIYQQQFQGKLKKQWEKCQYSYGDRGLSQLRQDIKVKLELIAYFGTREVTAITLESPNFELNDLVYLPILAEGSRIPFEYSFNQSQWFKILVAGGVGIAIFLLTYLFSGQGRFFGFFILIFQFINLFTGQDIKTLRIKHQAKELKRKLENKYQILVRLATDKITQILIITLDDEQQYYQQQIDNIAQNTNEKISMIKDQIEQQQEQMNMRKQDLQAILLLLK